ncbi:hypothetical protein MYX65_13185, partial [Acidobacteria bacterium AH-259-L09]|nr:hypothetical protein [Acidobacteria bacterium AH-259-L09]
WAFGCVLYECLTGRQVFGGETVTDIIGAIVHKLPDWNDLPENTPWNVRALLRRCLEKDPDLRLRDIWDVRIELKEALREPFETAALRVEAPAAQPPWRRAIPWAVAGLMAAALLTSLVGLWQATRPVEYSPMRLSVEVSPNQSLRTLPGAAAVLSPDGKRLAYVAGSGQRSQLYMRTLDQLEATALSGTQGAFNPFFSPDAQWVAFSAGGKLKKVSVSGGAPLTLCDSADNRGGSWSPDDIIIFAPSTTTGLWQVPAAGGTPEEITLLNKEKGETSHRWPQFLPDGKSVLFTARISPSFDEANIELLVLETGERKVLHQGGSYARYVPSGHLVFVREGTLFGVPFDLDRLEVAGLPAPILEGVVSNSLYGAAQFAFSLNGTFVYLSGAQANPQYSMVWVDRQGAVTPFLEEPRTYSSPALSPDGGRLALQINTGTNVDVWVSETERGTMTRLTFDSAPDLIPIWSPDGQRVAFSSSRDGGQFNLFWNLPTAPARRSS